MGDYCRHATLRTRCPYCRLADGDPELTERLRTQRAQLIAMGALPEQPPPAAMSFADCVVPGCHRMAMQGEEVCGRHTGWA